jgi:hypothetical protein
MSTHAIIGALQADGSVHSVYLHCDGYPSHCGRILAEHYSTAARVAALVKLGGLSVLGPVLAPAPGQVHNMRTRAPGVCLAYARDTGEAAEPHQFTRSGTAAEFWREYAAHFEFSYLFCPRSGWWARCSQQPNHDAPLSLLLEAMQQQQQDNT